MDIRLANQQWLHLYTARDPIGAAFVGASLYRAAAKKSRVNRQQVQDFLRASFAHAGLPEEIQTDWEPALHCSSADHFPSPFTLWLTGLGVTHLHSRPGVPTDDAEVERAHRTLYAYALADNLSSSVEQLQATLDQACQELNGLYPSRAHGCLAQPPLVAHPELLQPPRPFDPHYELASFDLARVDAFLASATWERKVGQTGQISLGGKANRYTVGRPWAGKTVQVHFDPTDRCLVASLNGQEIQRCKALHLEVEDLVGFSSITPCPLPQQLPLPLRF